MTTRRKTHCKRGHERTPDNIERSNGGCIQCSRARKRQERAAKPKRERDQITHANNLAGLTHYIQRRRNRGIPTEGPKVA